jgi:hypothetical protein
MKTNKHLHKLAEKLTKKDEYTSYEWMYNELLRIKNALLTGKFYAGVDSVSRSGMSRKISLAYIYKNQLHHIYHEKILELAGCNKDGRIGGCGMDMLFAAQYNLFISLHRSYSEAHYQKRMKRYNYLNS